MTGRQLWGRLTAGLDEEQARAVVGIGAFILTTFIAHLIWGQDATNIVYGLFIVWLLRDRVHLHEQADEATEAADLARGPTAPPYEPDEPDEPWKPAPPLPLAPIEPFGDSGPVRPHPFPDDQDHTPGQPTEPPVVESPDEWLARIEAQHQEAMARITAIADQHARPAPATDSDGD